MQMTKRRSGGPVSLRSNRIHATDMECPPRLASASIRRCRSAAALTLMMVAVSACGPGETPGGVGVEGSTPFFAFKLCPGEVITRLVIYEKQGGRRLWSADLSQGAAGSDRISWDHPEGYATTGPSYDTSSVPPRDVLYADAYGGEGRSLGSWQFSIDELRPNELLLGYEKPRYVAVTALSNSKPVGC